MSLPRISFGIIVLNGEPFILQSARSISICSSNYSCGRILYCRHNISTADGHSTDNTLEILHQFKPEEDPDNKVQIITRDGFWNEKDEQSQSYAGKSRMIDEFYKPGDMTAVINMIQEDPSISLDYLSELIN
ncbi:hypothetical protein L0152_33385 [bacterium]|nr:hypothetical protein [bacterium]